MQVTLRLPETTLAFWFTQSAGKCSFFLSADMLNAAWHILYLCAWKAFNSASCIFSIWTRNIPCQISLFMPVTKPNVMGSNFRRPCYLRERYASSAVWSSKEVAYGQYYRLSNYIITCSQGRLQPLKPKLTGKTNDVAPQDTSSQYHPRLFGSVALEYAELPWKELTGGCHTAIHNCTVT